MHPWPCSTCLHAAAIECRVVELILTHASSPPSADGSKLLLGSSSLSLWDTASQQRLAKLTGHPQPVAVLAFAPSGEHAVSAGRTERHVAVWDTTGSKRARKAGGAALASLSVEDPAVVLCTCAADGGRGSAFLVGAVSSAGEAYVWRCTPSGEAHTAAVQLLARVRVGAGPQRGGAAGGEDAILCAHLEAGGADGESRSAQGHSMPAGAGAAPWLLWP